ncbi:MAG: YciI family protein [Candidatus Acidiferrales bacterium]
MKYILLMTGSKLGVNTYRAWTKADADAHMAILRNISKELTESGEFVATQGLAGPDQATLVRGQKDGMPITDGIFPESKEFLLGYWIVDVKSPERAFAIAGRISAAAGPGGVPTNMPIEVRQIMDRPEKPS